MGVGYFLPPWHTGAGEEVGSMERAPAELGWEKSLCQLDDPMGLNGRGGVGSFDSWVGGLLLINLGSPPGYQWMWGGRGPLGCVEGLNPRGGCILEVYLIL